MKPSLLIVVLALATPILLPAQQPMPELSLTANDAQDVNLYPGWPLIVHATIMNSSRFPKNGAPAPLVIAPTGAPWTTSIQFTATDSSGQAHQWPLNLIGTAADPALTVAPASYVRFTMQMAPADVSSLLPGTYLLTATLQVSNSNAWNGIVHSRPVTVRVGPEPALTPLQQSSKTLLIAEYQTNSGDLDGALSGVLGLIQAQPANASAMGAAANLLELQGHPGFAFLQTSNALGAYFQANPSQYDPPFNLLAMNQRLFTQATASNVSALPTSTIASAREVTFSPADRTVTLSATVSTTTGPIDGGTVTFAIAGAGSPVTSSAVTQGNASVLFTIPGGTSAGNYPIVATYNGTATLSASSDSSAVLKIDKATAAINWSNPSDINYGTALGAAQLNAAATAPGLLVYYPPAGTMLSAGSGQVLSVSFTPSDAKDYNSATATVSLNVLPAPLTVTSNNASRQYGKANPPFGAVDSGFVNGETTSVLSGMLSCTSPATASSPVSGSPYAINCSGLSSPNYAIGYVPGVLTITPAPLTITATSLTKVLDEPNPSPLPWTASGFVNGENTSVLTTSPACSTTATTTSSVASYPITCSGASAANYAFAYVAGTLKVLYSAAIGHVIQPPINADGSSVFNQGRTVPAKFNVYDANGVAIGTPGVISSFFLSGIKSGTAATLVSDIVGTNNSDSVFRWDPTAQQWIFNITTANLSAGSTYIYTITLNDGSTIMFQFGLR